jgi:hypothetical protein
MFYGCAPHHSSQLNNNEAKIDSTQPSPKPIREANILDYKDRSVDLRQVADGDMIMRSLQRSVAAELEGSTSDTNAYFPDLILLNFKVHDRIPLTSVLRLCPSPNLVSPKRFPIEVLFAFIFPVKGTRRIHFSRFTILKILDKKSRVTSQQWIVIT